MERSEALETKPELEALIRERIATEGGIPFAEFMSLCLYHPRYGYYMAPRQRIGKEGDFFTSPSVHSLFGRLVCRQLRQMWEILGKGPFTLVEQGAGEGHLALDILSAAAEEAPAFYRALRYRLVEISPDNRRRQQEQLRGHLDRVDWCTFEDLDEIDGCFLANELVDAFPVHLLEKREGTLREVFVVARGGDFVEELRPCTTPGITEYFERIGVQPVEGNRFEVNLEATRWVAAVASRLRRGFVLAVDYGYPAAELFAPFRRGGTLMCYYRHSSSENPYQRIGFQDITTHIDFTALERYGADRGLEPLYFAEQYRFLMGLGFLEALMELQERETDERRAQALRLTLKNLIMPDGGMGGTFKALILGKGVDPPELLCARSLRDISLPGPEAR